MTRSDSEIAVTIILITFNSEKRVIACLDAIIAEVEKINGEIIVHDNNSSDSSVMAVRTRFPNVKIMESKRNIGFAAANNRAALAASGKFLLFLNPDAILDRGAISLMIKEAERLGAGAVAGRMRNPDGSFQPTCRNFPTMRNIFFSRGSILRRLIPSKSIVYTLGDFAETTEIPAAAATCLLMEREFFLRLGGFDPRFFLYMEDTDLCLRVHQAGRKIYFIPSAGGAHYWGESSPISEAGRSWRHHISVWKYFIKHYPGGFSLFVMPVALAANLIGGLILNRRRGKRAN